MKQFRWNLAHRIHQKNLPTPLLFEVSFCKINIFLRKRIVFQNFSYLCSDFLKHKAYELSSYTLSITTDFKLQPIVNTWIYIRRNTDETYYIPNYIISICHDDYSDMVRNIVLHMTYERTWCYCYYQFLSIGYGIIQ